MNQGDQDITDTPNWQARFMIVGGILGALVGASAAYLYVQAAEREGHAPEITGGEGVKLGMLVFGLLRSVATLGEGR